MDAHSFGEKAGACRFVIFTCRERLLLFLALEDRGWNYTTYSRELPHFLIGKRGRHVPPRGFESKIKISLAFNKRCCHYTAFDQRRASSSSFSFNFPFLEKEI
jgi:hypothetical protein